LEGILAWKYSNKVRDHYLHPRNIGEVENADATGEIGSMVCGDALKLTLKIEEGTEKILDAKFQTYGCGSAIASSSALTEIIIGKTVEESLKVSNQDLAIYLDGLPEEKMHCSVMGKDALEAAIANYKGIDHVHHEEDEGKIICHCFAVTDKQIESAIVNNNLTKVGEVTNYTKAGGACGACLPRIEDILKDVTSKREELSESSESSFEPIVRPEGKLSMFKKIKLIEEILDKEIRPALGYDHGGLDLIDVNDTTIFIKLTGQCFSCNHNDSTVEFIKGAIESVLGEDIILETMD
jgi:NifU-like protein